MRKHTSFAIAATILVVAATLWAKSSVLASSPDIARPNLSYVATASSFLPGGALEPMW